MRPDPRRVTLASLASMVAAIAPVHLTGALAPDIQAELGFGDAVLGGLIACFFAVSAATTPFGGRLADRVGPSRALRAAALLSVSASLAVAVVVDSWPVLVAVLAVAAVANAVTQPGNNAFIAAGVPAHRRGLALGVKQAAIPTSTALAGLALPTLAAAWGWRAAFWAAAVLAALVALGLPDVGRPRQAADAVPTRWRVSAPVLWLALGSGFGAAAVASIGGFLVRSARDAGFSEAGAGALQVAGSVALIAARVGWGGLMDRRPLDRFAFAAGLLAVGSLGFPLLASGRPSLMVPGALVAFAAAWSWPGVVHLGAVEGHPGDPGAATGVVQAGMFWGAMTGPAVFGLVAEHGGFAWAWTTSWAWAAVAAVLVAAAGRRQAARTPATS
ncbi:MAG: MFS transporter [Actinomyces sp.]|nr:MAG: MFS transporter [Actinomyces sp.]